jgi:lipopolysaccharide export system permease protein
LKILDKYILKQFLTTFVFVVLLLTSIIIALHYVEQNENFIKNKVSGLEILTYYISFAPYMANFLTPITVFIATVFMTAKLASHTEIVAILSSGVSFRRLLLPYMLGAGLITLTSFYMQGWIIPKANKNRVEFEHKYFEGQYIFNETNYHVRVGPESYVYMQSYSNAINTGFRFSIETIRENQLIDKLTAERIMWKPDSLGGGTWRLMDWSYRRFDDMAEEARLGREIDTLINMHPSDFDNSSGLEQTMTINELDAYIERLTLRGADNIQFYRIEKYVRFMSPFAAIILTFIGVILSSRKSRRGTGAQIAAGFVLAALFIVAFLISRNIAENTVSFHPLVAVWTPNVLFSLVGIVLYKTLPR